MTTWCFASRISWNTSIIPCKWERPGLIFQSSLQGGGIGGISLRCPFLVSTCCDNPRQASSTLLKTGGFSDFMLGKHFHELLACLEGVYNTWFLLDLYFTALGWCEFSGLILGGSFQKTMLTKINGFFFKGSIHLQYKTSPLLFPLQKRVKLGRYRTEFCIPKQYLVLYESYLNIHINYLNICANN